MPVDSDFERKALRRILDCQRLLHPRGINLAIGKPLFDTMTPDGPCRPDFVIEARSRHTGEIRTVIVEAMGFAAEDYEAAKAVTHPRMRHLGKLVTINPAEVDGDDATEKLLAALDL